MTNRIRLALALHNHQPIGNFDQVIESAYIDSYLPFLDLFTDYQSLKIALHISGSLIEWLDAKHPEYLDRLARLVQQGRVEIIGGAFYEPILAMIPSRDRIGQICSYTTWLQKRLGATIRGMWIPERVWEQNFTRDLVDAGIEYTILDDFHFKNAGLEDEQLTGYYVTEDEGRVLAVFPGSERLRYTIPFADPQRTIDYLADIAQRHSDAVIVFGDDGEKFGTWPETHKHCYTDGWLRRFFDALVANQDWLQVTTPSEALDKLPPLGKIYLPDGSYREMTEWALPVQQQLQYEQLQQQLRDNQQLSGLWGFLRGGFWRNFKAKYPEADEMYARMMLVSRRLEDMVQSGAVDRHLEQARRELYRGQCNCGYWHGAFGGIYLPHLRNAVYHHLISADNLLEQAAGRNGPWVEAVAEDYNFDARQEIRLANDRLVSIFVPSRGGQMLELDVRSICHNLLATITRQPEAYHRKVRAGAHRDNGQCASIHERVVFKQADLDRRLHYDDHPRKALVDLFYDLDAALEAVATCRAAQRGDFVGGAYEGRIRRNPDRIQVMLSREGQVDGLPVKITKGVTLDAGSPTLIIAYLLEGLPSDRALHFAVEFNFALPAGCDDRYFLDAGGQRLGHLGTQLDLPATQSLTLVDQWLGIEAGLKISRPAALWAFPVETVSQSEGGFELVHQSVAVVPHWFVTAENGPRWAVTMQLTLDTSRAESRSAHCQGQLAAITA